LARFFKNITISTQKAVVLGLLEHKEIQMSAMDVCAGNVSCFSQLSAKDRVKHPEKLDPHIILLLFYANLNLGPQIRSSFMPITLHVFQGGEVSTQALEFRTAYSRIRETLMVMTGRPIQITLLTVKSCKEKGWSFEDVIDWLLSCHVHFVLSHIHQGLERRSAPLDMSDCVLQLQRLQFHPGFPTGDFTMCPVFNQNKGVYIEALGSMANPTHYMLVKDVISDYSQEEIEGMEKFAEKNFERDNKGDSMGWVLKAPFTTNSGYVKFPKTLTALKASLKLACHDLYGKIPYVMVQPRLFNRRESKVVCIGGVPSYICAVAANHATGPVFATPREIIAFAQKAIDKARIKLPHLLYQGLFRVDVMCRQKGRKLIVNEFESLEANYGATGNLENTEQKVREYLEMYWEDRLIESFSVTADLISEVEEEI
jgi:hypothetical protein